MAYYPKAGRQFLLAALLLSSVFLVLRLGRAADSGIPGWGAKAPICQNSAASGPLNSEPSGAPSTVLNLSRTLPGRLLISPKHRLARTSNGIEPRSTSKGSSHAPAKTN